MKTIKIGQERHNLSLPVVVSRNGHKPRSSLACLESIPRLLPVAVNGFAVADLNRDGLPDVVATRQVRTGFFAPRGGELPQDRLDVLINRGEMNFESYAIQITGSDLTPERFGVSAEIPNLAGFNGDGFLNIFVTRSGGKRYQKHGNTLLLSTGVTAFC